MFQNRTTFLTCTLTGTHASQLFQLLTTSGSHFLRIDLPLLSHTDMQQITVQFLNQTIGWQQPLPSYLDHAIYCTGGNPRMLSVLLMQASSYVYPSLYLSPSQNNVMIIIYRLSSLRRTPDNKFSRQQLRQFLNDCSDKNVELLIERTSGYVSRKYQNYFNSPEGADQIVKNLVIYSLLEKHVERYTVIGTDIVSQGNQQIVGRRTAGGIFIVFLLERRYID